jgi:two-component system chemotaxis sensor kinase CheA
MGKNGVTELQDIVKEFLVESYENLDQLDRDLLTLEQNPTSQPTLSSIFRTIHTIKGTCGFFGFGKLECVAHVGENLLSKLRDRDLELRPEITTGLLGLVDAIRRILGSIETTGAEGGADYTALIDTLVGLQNASIEEALAPTPYFPWPAQGLAEPFDKRLTDSDVYVATGDNKQGGVSDGTIRVEVGLLDKLISGIGELVLVCNQMLQFRSAIDDPAYQSTSQRLNLITAELQGLVMQTRLQPIGTIWSKFPRVVRDLAVQCGKQVRIEMEGEETQLDKTIAAAIKDPLTHLVRNAVDHGIESPAIRLAAGKPAEGRLLLRAVHERCTLHIEISDDGGGLNLHCIRQKAIERGLITADQARQMSDLDVARLTFAAGLSTAAQVTNVSGRGVGLDVVKTNIEKIGGIVDIDSRPGHGTTVKLSIPLAAATTPARCETTELGNFEPCAC